MLQLQDMFSTVYGDNAYKKIAIFKWIKNFQVVRENCKDDARPELPSNTCDNQNIKYVQSLMLSDRIMTVQILADTPNIGKSSVHTILMENLRLKKLCAKIVIPTRPKVEVINVLHLLT